MNRQTVTAASGLKLCELRRLSIFKRIRNRIVLAWHPGRLSVASIPGSVVVTSAQTEKGYEKTLTCKAVSENYRLADTLLSLRESRLLAIYTDGRGQLRVCGSPEYPLRLRYTIQEGVAMLTLTGTDTHDDGYLMLG